MPALYVVQQQGAGPDSDRPQTDSSAAADLSALRHGGNLVELTQSDLVVNSEVPTWYEPYEAREPSPAVLKKVTCFKNIQRSEFLPAVMTTNLRSLGPKIKCFIQEFKLREILVALLNEMWGKSPWKRRIKNMLVLNLSVSMTMIK